MAYRLITCTHTLTLSFQAQIDSGDLCRWTCVSHHTLLTIHCINHENLGESSLSPCCWEGEERRREVITGQSSGGFQELNCCCCCCCCCRWGQFAEFLTQAGNSANCIWFCETEKETVWEIRNTPYMKRTIRHEHLWFLVSLTTLYYTFGHSHRSCVF